MSQAPRPRHAARLPRIGSLKASIFSRQAIRIGVPALAAAALVGTVATAGVIGGKDEPQLAVAPPPTVASDVMAAREAESVTRDLEREELGQLRNAVPQAAPLGALPALPAAPAAPAKAAEKPAEKKDEQKKESAKPEAAGTRYATESLNVRSKPSTDARTVGQYSVGDAVKLTSETSGDWRQVIYRGESAWVKGDYLSKDKPAPARAEAADKPAPKAAPKASAPKAAPKAAAPKAADSKPAAGGASGAACASGSSVEKGLSSSAIKVHRGICNKFPFVTSFGGIRGGSGSYHNSGRAVDAMVSGQRGWDVANWVRANAGELGVTEVIYAQKIWTVQRSSEGWRSMSDRGSATQNHYDHVHVSTR